MVLLLLAAVVVVGAALSGSVALVFAAAVAAVVLGAAATRITHTEVLVARREGARDRALQAREYRALTVERIAEQARYVDRTQAAIAAREQALVELGTELAGAQKLAATAGQESRAATLRADRAENRAATAEEQGRATAARLDDAEGRAAEAIVAMVELEHELDALRAELGSVTTAWRAATSDRRRA